jgi:hypothetical protein
MEEPREQSVPWGLIGLAALAAFVIPLGLIVVPAAIQTIRVKYLERAQREYRIPE